MEEHVQNTGCNFIIWGIFSALGLKFHYYLQSYCLASSSWILSQCSRRSVENLAGALWSLADWDEVGEGKPHRVFVPITETVKGWREASMCGVGQEVIRHGHGRRAEGSGRTLVNPLSAFLTFCFIGFSLIIHIFPPEAFKVKLQTWCPIIPKYRHVYFLGTRIFSYINTVLWFKKTITQKPRYL